MQTLEIGGRPVPVNDKGFLVHFSDWNEDVAKTMAEQDHLELAECHWAAFRFMRGYYAEYEVPPSPRVLIQEVGNQLQEYRCGYGTLKTLFPLGGCKQACRLAGLPEYYCHAC